MLVVRERSRRGVEVDRGVVSPGLSGATTTTEHHGGGAAPAHCLLADRVGGVATGREHMILRVIRRGHASLPVCREVVSPGGAASPIRCLASPSGGVNGMCVWHVGERAMFLRRRRQLWGGRPQGAWAFQLGTRIC